ncbi:hypothetical protein V8E53_003197 [Lactarius tabidus]
MPKKPENELTKDEERLLIVSAKLYTAIQEHMVCLPVTEEHKAYWLEKLTEEMHTVKTIYNKYVNSNKPPQLHPAGQHVGHEWTEARKSDQPFCWEAITLDAITHGCKQQCSNPLNIKWHPDLSAIDISTYLREIAQKHWWWTHPPPPAAVPVEDVTMDNPTPDEPALPPLLTCSHSSHCAAKGKTPVHALATPATPLPPSAGPSKSKKCHADTPESENNVNLFAVQDEEAGADANEDTPCKVGQVLVIQHIKIDHASPHPCKIPKVIHTLFDEVSTTMYTSRDSPHRPHSGPCIALGITDCKSQLKEPSTMACKSCAIKKKKCNPIADWAKPVPDYALYPIQECLDVMEWHFAKLIHLNVAMARILQVDASTIEAVTAPCPALCSQSPGNQSGSSPGLGISSLTFPSSDALSFDEDDMYGSDPDVKTISLLPFRAVPKLETNESLHNDIVSQMDRLNLNMERGTVMLSALCEVAGLDVLSILLNVPAHPSGALSPQLWEATLVASRGATDDGN